MWNLVSPSIDLNHARSKQSEFNDCASLLAGHSILLLGPCGVIRVEVSAGGMVAAGPKTGQWVWHWPPQFAGFRIFQIIKHASVQTDWSVGGVAIGDSAAYTASLKTELWYTSGHERTQKNVFGCMSRPDVQGNVEHKSDSYFVEFAAHLHIVHTM